MKSIIFLLLFALPSWGEVFEMKIDNLAHPIKISLPENFDAKKKHPAILYYHGTNGRPDTRLIRQHTGNENWIVVGMTYYQQGQATLDNAHFSRELSLYHLVRKHLFTKYRLDPNHIYVSGFSKGGWMTDLLLQQEPSVRGGAIMGAGHLFKSPKPLARYNSKKPVFIGIGRHDGNYPFALNAVVHHRSMGARTDMETWETLGHSFPPDGSPALKQWLDLLTATPENAQKKATQECDTLFQDALSLDPLPQWDALRHLRDLPYAKVLGKDFRAKIDSQISTLTAKDPVKTEAAALKAHRRLLATEMKGHTVQGLRKLVGSYALLAGKYSGTREAKLIIADHDRCAALLKKAEALPQATPKKNPVRPSPSPSPRPTIPVNPLVR